jgi:hypothetical protein
VIVRFVDIGGIDDHHCLNFLLELMTITVYEEFEDTNGVIRISKSSKDRKHAQWSNEKRQTTTQNIHKKLMIEYHEPH